MAKGEARLAEKAAVAEQRVVEQRLQREKVARARAEIGGLWSRRDVFGRFAWSVFAAFSGITLLAALRSAFPAHPVSASHQLQSGVPVRFHDRRGEHQVSEGPARVDRRGRRGHLRHLRQVHAPRLHAALAGGENKFKCPCHGSGFYKTGINFEGPAPRPLERVRITKAEDGQIVIDKGVKYLFEKGEWNKPGAYLKV
jgi:cytochrome b6-f complex iron-sulfur subunit